MTGLPDVTEYEFRHGTPRDRAAYPRAATQVAAQEHRDRATNYRSEALGVRLHNPLNIERGAAHGRPDTAWRGLAAHQVDPRFVAYAEPVYGFRAGARILLNYQRLHGVRTIAAAVARWAPAEDDNDPIAYAARVEEFCGIPRFADLEFTAPTMARLVLGMARVECGAGHPFQSCQATDGALLAVAREVRRARSP